MTLTPGRRDEPLQHWVTYVIDIPAKKPGPYQVRVAVRDVASGRVGSAYEFVRVPDLDSGDLVLSGILTMDASAPAVWPPASDSGRADAIRFESDAPAVRRVFAPGSPVAYGVTVFNAQVGRETRQVQLATRVRLLRDGREVLAGQSLPVDISGQADVKAIFASGTLLLPPQLEEGDYALQVTVTDGASPTKVRAAMQTVELEVRR